MLLRLKTTSWERLASASTDSTIPYFATHMHVYGKPIATGIIMLLKKNSALSKKPANLKDQYKTHISFPIIP